MPEPTKPRRAFGSLFKRPNGTWLARYPDPNGKLAANGRVKIISRTLPSKKAGERFLKEMEKAIAAAPPPKSDDGEPVKSVPTLLDVIDGFLAVRGKRLAKKTLGAYRSSRQAVAMHSIANIPIDTLRPADIDDYLDWRAGVSLVALRVGNGKAKTSVRKGRKAKAGTINRDHTVIQAALSEQVRNEVIDRNPASLVRRRKTQQSPRQAFQKSELRRLIACCEEEFLPLVLTAVYTGARLGELGRLVWGDVYFETAQVMIRRTKTGSASAVPMHPELARILSDLKKERAAADDRIVPATEPVFLTPHGKTYKEVRAPWRRAMKAAGLSDRKDLTFHSLRHTFATTFLEGGAAVTDLQHILGHKNLTTTQIYAHMVNARARASVEALDYGIAGVKLHDAAAGKVRAIG